MKLSRIMPSGIALLAMSLCDMPLINLAVSDAFAIDGMTHLTSTCTLADCAERTTEEASGKTASSFARMAASLVL